MTLKATDLFNTSNHYNIFLYEKPISTTTYNLVWADEFDTNGAVNPTKWYHQTQLPAGGSWFNGEVQHYTNQLTNSFVNAFDSGLHTVYVVGKNRNIVSNVDINEYSNPRYISSDASDFYSFGTLGSTTLTRVDELLSWTEVDGRQVFELYENNMSVSPKP